MARVCPLCDDHAGFQKQGGGEFTHQRFIEFVVGDKRCVDGQGGNIARGKRGPAGIHATGNGAFAQECMLGDEGGAVIDRYESDCAVARQVGKRRGGQAGNEEGRVQFPGPQRLHRISETEVHQRVVVNLHAVVVQDQFGEAVGAPPPAAPRHSLLPTQVLDGLHAARGAGRDLQDLGIKVSHCLDVGRRTAAGLNESQMGPAPPRPGGCYPPSLRSRGSSRTHLPAVAPPRP